MNGDKASSHGTGRQTLRLWPEFAKAIGIGRNVAYERAGKDFKVVRIGKRILVAQSELERLLSGETRAPKSGDAKRTNFRGTKR